MARAVVIFQNHLSRQLFHLSRPCNNLTGPAAPVMIPCNILTGNYTDKKVPIPDTPGYPFTTALRRDCFWQAVLEEGTQDIAATFVRVEVHGMFRLLLYLCSLRACH